MLILPAWHDRPEHLDRRRVCLQHIVHAVVRLPLHKDTKACVKPEA